MTNSPARPTILIVDDSVANRLDLSRVLRNSGFETLEAANGGQGLAKALTNPDLIILDVRLPDIPGFEVARRLKTHPATCSIPILHISSSLVEDEAKVRGLENADSFLATPIDPMLMLATVRSLLRMRRAEEAARASAQQWQRTFDALSDAIFLIDKAGLVLNCNAAAIKFLGRTRYQVVGQPLEVVLADLLPLDKETVDRMVSADTRLESDRQNVRRWFRITSDPVHEDPVGGAAVVVVTETTSARLADEEATRLRIQFQQAQKLESLGILAGGIAHDFNNLLVGIMGSIELAQEEIPPDSPALTNLNDIDNAAKTAADLCRQMLAYSGKGRFIVEPLDLNGIIREMTQLLFASVSRKPVVEFQLAPRLPAVQGDGTQLRQIVMNLFTNASEAIGDATGTITLRTGTIWATKTLLAHSLIDENRAEGLYSYLEIRDTGSGMDEATRKRIFDPFFTTKFTGRGLGLAAVLGIVRSHGGNILLDSGKGQGTCFRVLFPALDHVAAKEVKPVAAIQPWRGEGTVLVVDDVATVLAVARRILEKRGLKVLTAENGRIALDIYKENRDRISCIVLDLTMPEMDGVEALRELRKMDSDVPVILSSGFNEQEAVDRFTDLKLAGFIPKPYQANTLVEKVREAIALGKGDGATGAKAGG